MSDDDTKRDSGDDDSADGDTRYGHADGPRGSGHQESKKLERKETDAGFVPRQGGDQSRHGQDSGEPRRV